MRLQGTRASSYFQPDAALKKHQDKRWESEDAQISSNNKCNMNLGTYPIFGVSQGQ
jgi:hypothetical protein